MNGLADGSPAIVARGVSLIREGRLVLREVDWTVAGDEHWVVFGPNGSGKTSLLQVVSTYRVPSRGRVEVLGEQVGRVDVRRLRRRIGYVGAEPASLVHPNLPALDVVVTGRRASFVDPRFDTFTPEEWERAEAALERLGAGALAGRRYGTLSEGEKKRTLIARALVTDPALLLLDEPTSALDLGGREDLIHSLAGLAGGDGPPMVMVTHHLEEIPPGFGHMLLLSQGAVVERGPITEVLTEDTLSHAFGTRLRIERHGDRWRGWSAKEA